MTQQRILMAAMALLAAAMSCHPQVATMLDSPAWGADTAKPRSGKPTSASAGTLVGKALQAMDDALGRTWK